MLFAYDARDVAARELRALLEGGLTAAPVAAPVPCEIVDLSALPVARRRALARCALLPRGASHDDVPAGVEELAEAACFFGTPDGVGGVVQSAADVGLVLREAQYHAGLAAAVSRGPSRRLEPRPRPIADDDLARAAAEALECREGVFATLGFMGLVAARSLAEAAAAELEAMELLHQGGGGLGVGRGDQAGLMDELPEALLESLDTLVEALCSAGGRVGRRLRCCGFRSWPMLSQYEPGTRFTWHRDNGSSSNGRVLTCVYYLNEAWAPADGGALRLLEHREDGDMPCCIVMEVEPLLDTLVIFWADEVPHEVLPPRCRPRLAISVWYLCPLLGDSQFTQGSPLPAFGRAAAAAAEHVLSALAGEEAPLGDLSGTLACLRSTTEGGATDSPGEGTHEQQSFRSSSNTSEAP